MNQTNSSSKLLFISFYYKIILFKNFHAGLGTSEVIGHYCSVTFISYISIRMNIILCSSLRVSPVAVLRCVNFIFILIPLLNDFDTRRSWTKRLVGLTRHVAVDCRYDFSEKVLFTFYLELVCVSYIM